MDSFGYLATQLGAVSGRTCRPSQKRHWLELNRLIRQIKGEVPMPVGLSTTDLFFRIDYLCKQIGRNTQDELERQGVKRRDRFALECAAISDMEASRA